MKAVAEWFGGVRGRKKSILLISEGIDYDIYDVFNKRDASMIQDQMRELIRAATRSNVSIYPIDPERPDRHGGSGDRAERSPRPEMTAIRRLPISARAVWPTSFDCRSTAFARSPKRLAGLPSSTRMALRTASRSDRRREQLVLRPRILSAESEARSASSTKIDVKVNRPGLTVRARRGYAAPTSKSANAAAAKPSTISAEIRDALQRPSPGQWPDAASLCRPVQRRRP